ncbi:MAG: TadE family protein [Acidimicrobiales bacterium]
MVEFALVLPVFALMLFAMVQFGLAFAGWAQLRNEAQTAARSLAMGDTPAADASCTADHVSGDVMKVCELEEVKSLVEAPVGTSGTPKVAIAVPGDGTVRVCVAISAPALTGFLPAFTLRADSEFYIEKANGALQSYNPDDLSNCAT